MSALALTVPLEGVQLIEASAGTGKTWTVATLFTRLVIEAGLAVSSVLAVTYTVAATKELRDRVRARLQHALQLAEAGDEAIAADAALAPLLTAALVRDGRAGLLQRLREAVAGMDRAPIHTIHAFCQRALAEHAVDAGRAPLPQVLVANERGLRLDAATAFWRAESRTDEGVRLLSAWASPEDLADTLRELLAVDTITPPAPPSPAASPGGAEDLDQACRALAQAHRLHGAAARQAMALAIDAGTLNRQRFKDSTLEAVWSSLDNWVLTDLDPDLPHAHLAWFGSAQIAAKRNARATGPTPSSPLFDAIDAFVAAREACAARERYARLALLHRLRAHGAAWLAARKRELGQQGFDDLVPALAEALEGPTGEALAARMRQQYGAALIDEFQDTDARQAGMFRRLFGDRALFLVGDPKQAIYRFRGGDVLAYLQAREGAGVHALERNFRSRPALLAALQAVFEHAGADAFAWPGIAFHPVAPGGTMHDGDLLRAGRDAPALVMQHLRGIESQSIGAVREQAASACAGAVLALLGDGERRDRHGARGPVSPGDIAILVERNADIAPMREALARHGIPSVARGRASVYRSEEASDVRALLLALRAPGDEARLRAALAAPLFGFDAAALVRLGGDEPWQREWQDRFVAWRERLGQHGPLGVVADACALNAPRLLTLADGERRLGNYLQLAEALQAAAPAAAADRVLDELERRIAAADPDNEEELPRLESDAARVAILTVHRAKGLEWEFVFLPFLATQGTAGAPRSPRRARINEGGRTRLHFLGHDVDTDADAETRAAAEERAERLRLAYVALTRARLATWIVWGAAKDVQETALAWLLHRQAGAACVERPDEARIDADLARLRARAPAAIAIEDAVPAPATARYRPARAERVPAARQARRALPRDWWVYSYSLLAGEARSDAASSDERGADDESDVLAPPLPPSRFAGARFGNALHAALEWADAERWLGRDGDAPPAGEGAKLDRALRAQGYVREDDLLQGGALLARLVADTLNAPLPEGTCLAALPRTARRDEMEFHLGLQATAIGDLIAVLHAHGVAVDRTGFGLRERIEGLLTGRIDVVYEAGGRVFVLDYKSNRLADYSPASVAQAIRHGQYDLQYVLYTLAVHRWLRFRRPGYDYARDFGGVRYLFCRGLGTPGEGIHAVTPPFALIDALDRLFAGAEP